MKEILTTKMSQKDRHMLMGNVLGSFGNDNIRAHHIVYFENKIIENDEKSHKDASTTPNYFAWLCLMSEHLFWTMRSFCFKQNEFEHDEFTLVYNELITRFCDSYSKLDSVTDDQLQDLFERAVKVLELRHAIIHRGFPNLLPIVFEKRHVRNKPQVTKGGLQEKFTEQSSKETIKWFWNPQNFDEIKQDFNILLKSVRSGPGFSIGL